MTKKCKWCGREFETSNSRLYCSDKCKKERDRLYSKWILTYDGRNWDDREELFKLWLKRNGYGRT